MNWFKQFWKALTEPTPGVLRIVYGDRIGANVTTKESSGFTPDTLQVIALARKEAERLDHNFLGTEHVLLGLIKHGHNRAVRALVMQGVNLETMCAELEKEVGRGPLPRMIGNIPYTPRVKKVVALAQKEAKQLNHNYVGTDHLLLGLLREGDGVAAKVLRSFGVDIERTRQEILRELDPNFSTDQANQPGTQKQAAAHPAGAQPALLDTARRYDIYCLEGNRELVVYRNALFKSAKTLFPNHQYDFVSVLFELEKADGQTILISRSSVIKFCEPGVTPGGENVPPESFSNPKPKDHE